MGVELLEVGVKVRKGVMFTIRGCFRSAKDHPFLVGILCFLIFLYRLSPFVFQLLVSASPILVCTAVLLGTILSFGQPNIPEIEVEEETAFEAVSVKTGVLGETAVVEKNESYYVERFSETSRDEREHSDDTAPLIEERSVETEVNDGEVREGRRELGDLVYEQKADWIEERLGNGEILENHFATDVKVNDESDDEKSEADSFGSEKVNVDSLDSPPRSPWARGEEREDEVEEGEEDDDDDDDDSDSGSSRAESSSPDASMADILPMLDELHPLLDEEAPRIVEGACTDFDAGSEKSGRSGTSDHESEESENREDLEVADDDNEDEEGNKEEERKSAIAWTEEDQKNLMDLGSSEIERNQRLENLILRRRARKMFADKNLIDLDSADLPFDIAPISTRRHNNPFDHAHDYYDDHSGLPPIPGSAPSVLLQRRNPFDIPYDSSEEKPDLMGDGFKEEFTSQPRESFFRRHESFNVGPSNFAPRRKDVKMRPFFVPEGSVSEESSSSMFQRQSSELSESKLSSVPDTESISSVTSVEDQEDRKLPEEDNLPEVEVIAETKEEGPSGDSEVVYQQEVELEENVHQMISMMECVSEHVGHGSQSSEEEEEDSFELGHVENRDVELIELESRLEDVADHSDSSSSSLSEVSERVFTMTEGEGLPMVEAERNDVAEEPHISNETSLETTGLNISNLLVNDVAHRGPVYDTSPRELSNIVSSSLISCDVHPESDLGSIPAVDRTNVSSIEREIEGSSLAIETDIPQMARSSEDQNLEDIYSLLPGDSPLEVNALPFEGQMRADNSDGVEETVLREPNFMHLNEVQASSTSIESFVDGRVTQKSNMPKVQELDHYISSNVISPSSHEFVAIPPNAFETTTSHVDEGIIVEEVDEIKEMDDVLLSELDSVGDFSIKHMGSDSIKFDKHIDSVGEANLSSLHETSSVRYFEVHSVGMNQIEDVLHSKNSREHVDIYEEDVECISELQTSRAENIGSSRMEFNENDSQETPRQETVSMENEVQHGYSSENHDYEGTFSTVFRPAEDVDAVPLGKAELTSVVTEIIEGGAEVSTQGQVYNDINSAMLELEAGTVEDIDLAFKQISSKEIEKSVVLEPPQVEVHSISAFPESEVQSIQDAANDIEIPSGVLSLEANKFQDIDLASAQISPNEIEKPAVLEPPQAELHNAILESKVQSGEEVDAVSEKSESRFVGSEIIVGGAVVSSLGQVDTETVSGMPKHEASTTRDIDLAFDQTSFNEMETPVVSNSPQAELHNAILESDDQSAVEVDAISEKSELTFVGNEIILGGAEVSSQGQVDTGTVSGIPELEASTIRDIDLASEHISSKEMEMPVISESPQAELHDYEDIVSGMPEPKVQSKEHADVLEKGETISVETDTTMGGVEVSCQLQFDTNATSGMTELEASSIEDINLAFKEISSKGIEKTVSLEPHNHEDTVSILDQSTEHVDAVSTKVEFKYEVAENLVKGGEISCQAEVDTNTTSGMTELEARTVEDIDLAFEQISSKETEKPVFLETPEAEQAVGETTTKISEDSTVTISVCEVGQIKDTTFDHVIKSEETQAESIPSEDTILSPKHALDGETMKQDDGSVEVEEDKPGLSKESPKDLHSASSVKGKGKVFKSSSSSSSSESSSSDSDKE